MFRRILINIHKILGLFLCVLFLTWFLSGFVMIFHSFPKVSPQDRINKQRTIGGNLRSIEELSSILPDTIRLQSITLDMYLDRPVFHLRERGETSNIYADSLSAVPKITDSDIAQIVRQWNNAPVVAIDTLWRSDQWLMPKRLGKDVPAYKYWFGDEEKHQLYISSQTGTVLQYTDKDERFWAWLGAIPHWVYFTSLRQNQKLWTEFVKWTSGIGSIMCLIGIILGIWLLWKTRYRRFKSPYRKWWFHWHYISGLVFGLFAMTFAFSGLMSMIDLPDWLKKKPKNAQTETRPRGRMAGEMRGGTTLDLTSYILDYRLLVEEIEDIKNIEWVTYQKVPYYRVTTNAKTLNIDASDSASIRPFVLTEEMVHQAVRQIHGDSVAYSVELIKEHDNQYYDRRKTKAPLPVYRVIVEDELRTRYYYNPETLSQRRMDDNSRLRSFLYGGLHSLNFKFLTDRPLLWYIVMFTLLIGGTFLSLTGVILSIKWVTRKIRKASNKYTNKRK